MTARSGRETGFLILPMVDKAVKALSFLPQHGEPVFKPSAFGFEPGDLFRENVTVVPIERLAQIRRDGETVEHGRPPCCGLLNHSRVQHGCREPSSAARVARASSLEMPYLANLFPIAGHS